MRNMYMAHPENVLFTMVSDEDAASRAEGFSTLCITHMFHPFLRVVINNLHLEKVFDHYIAFYIYF